MVGGGALLTFIVGTAIVPASGGALQLNFFWYFYSNFHFAFTCFYFFPFYVMVYPSLVNKPDFLDSFSTGTYYYRK